MGEQFHFTLAEVWILCWCYTSIISTMAEAGHTFSSSIASLLIAHLIWDATSKLSSGTRIYNLPCMALWDQSTIHNRIPSTIAYRLTKLVFHRPARALDLLTVCCSQTGYWCMAVDQQNQGGQLGCFMPPRPCWINLFKWMLFFSNLAMICMGQ